MTPDQPTATATDYPAYLADTPNALQKFESMRTRRISDMTELWQYVAAQERELSSAQAALAEAKAEVARLNERAELDQTTAAENTVNDTAELTALRAELQQIADTLPKRSHDTIGAAKDVMEDLAELRARVAELQRLLGEVYRNTNLRHHPELTGLADIVSKQLST